MSELVAVAFDNPHDADRVLTELTRVSREYLIELEDAVIVIRGPDGAVRLKQSLNLVAAGTSYGVLSGAVWGTLIGLLFLNPLLGMVTGGALGAGAGALSGSLVDYGINDDFIREIGQSLKPDSSALFLLIRKAQPEKILSELSDLGVTGRIIRSSLSPEQEARLQEAISSPHIGFQNRTAPAGFTPSDASAPVIGK